MVDLFVKSSLLLLLLISCGCCSQILDHPSYGADFLQAKSQRVRHMEQVVNMYREGKLDKRLTMKTNGPRMFNAYEWASKECARDMKVIDAAKDQPEVYSSWILQYTNADAKGTFPPKGALLGTPDAPGSYDQCLKVYPTDMLVNDTNGKFVGLHNFSMHYCKARYMTNPSYQPISEGWCVPQSCWRTDIHMIIEKEKIDNPDSLFAKAFPHHYTYCFERTPMLKDTGAIVALSILGFFGCLVAIATVVDGLYSWYLSKKQEEADEKHATAVAAAAAAEEASKAISGGEFSAGQTNPAFEHGGEAETALTEKVALSATTHSGNVSPETEASEKQADTVKSSAVIEAPAPEKITGCSGHALYRALTAFSVLKTIPMLMETGGARSTFGCMNGIRFFSMAWVVLGHTWVLYTANPHTPFTTNMLDLNRLKGRFGHQIINQVDLPVDPFFLIGSTLVTYSFMRKIKSLEKMDPIGRIGEMIIHYFHRYWRLTPIVAAIMLVAGNLWMYCGHGPNFPEGWETNSCKKYWWVNLLYLQNLYHPNYQLCIGWTWYLANDMQYFLVAPIFIYALYKKPVIGYILLGLAWCGTTAARGVTMHKVYQGRANGFFDLYIKPWNRFGPYAQGILLGYIISRTKGKLKINKIIVLVGWILAFALGLIVCFAQWKKSIWQPRGLAIAWDVLKRDAFTLAISWVVFACVHGYGGLANSFLGWGFFNPLAKLSYASYLIHPLIHAMALANQMQPIYVQDLTMTTFFIANLVLSLLVSIPFTLVFEYSFGELEKVFLPSRRKTRS